MRAHKTVLYFTVYNVFAVCSSRIVSWLRSSQASYAKNDALLPFLSIMPADVASSGMVATGATADVYRGTYSQSTDVALRLAGSPHRSETKHLWAGVQSMLASASVVVCTYKME